MNRRVWIIASILLIWIAFSGLWYLCSIKKVCPENLMFWKKDNASIARDTANKPLTFFWNSAKPILQDSFNPMIDDLFGRIGQYDTLVIVGVYFNGESGVKLGYDRAESLWDYLTHYIDYERVKTESYPESFVTPSKDSSFEAVRFRVIAGENPELEIVEEKENNLYRLTIWFRDRTTYKLMTRETEVAVNRLVDTLKSKNSYRVDVVGHTGNDGTEEENDLLGRQRAWSVKKMLWDKGLEPNKIITASKGSQELMSPTDPVRNQRVEIFAIPIE